MSPIEIYIDEDAMDSDLVAALRSRGVIVMTALDAGLNVSDFYRLHTEYLSAGREHAGMILSPQQRFSVGEQLRRLLHLRSATTMEAMRNRVEFLSNWA